MNRKTPLVVYLLRKTSLTITDIKLMRLPQIMELFDEVKFQEASDDYATATYLAHILAGIANTIPTKSGRGHKASEFLTSEPPVRGGKTGTTKQAIEGMAEKVGITLPGKKKEE